ncbi:Cannabidiolic acid synthase [Capsicum baccatum]|uniref:Cannabidiolic acid synthase n=1 Tax=Capsicum baccatum TaxID=33114 RepID=A0A2G2VAH0_CAPBA|nr:Cannabidiolic acid synthase [Capsicum baccatum]
MLDLSNLNEIKIDLNEETAWVQAGATLGELYYAIAKRSKVHGFPGGVCFSVGTGGLISGGGLGALTRKFGLAADNVVDARMMDVNGNILVREMNEDLFWAVRGGGGASFGVILAWKLKLVRVPEKKHYYKGTSDFVKTPIPESGWEMIERTFLEEAGPPRMILELLGGKMNEISESETPFPHRKGNLYNIQYTVGWSDNSESISSQKMAWLRKLYKEMEPYVAKSPRTAYLNYRDLDFGTNQEDYSYSKAKMWGEKYFNGNFERLGKVKSKVDPNNFFKHEQSIPPYSY